MGDKGDNAGTGPQGHIDEPDIEEVHPSVWAWVRYMRGEDRGTGECAEVTTQQRVKQTGGTREGRYGTQHS